MVIPKERIIFVLLFILVAAILSLQYFGKRPGTGEAQLTWNANAEEDLAGYRIYYGTEKRTGDCPPAGYPKKVEVKGVTTYKLTSLDPGKTYYFSVTSFNKGGKESCFSEEMSKKIRITTLDRLKNIFSR